jgi:hypothetical protein
MAEPLSAFDEPSSPAPDSPLAADLPTEPLSDHNHLLLPAEDQERLAAELFEIIDGYKASTETRRKRWEDIDRAFNLMPDTERQGVGPDASQLVSEITRHDTIQAAARITNQILDADPLVGAFVIDDKAQDEETQMRLEQARDIQEFFEAYAPNEMRLNEKIPLSILQATRLGCSFFRILWEIERKTVRVRQRSGKYERKIKERGRVVWTRIHPRDMILWPLDGSDVQRDCTFVGHRTWLTPSEFRQAAMRWRLSQSEIKKSLVAGDGDTDTDGEEERRKKEVEPGHNPHDCQIPIIEATVEHMLFEGDDYPERLMVILDENRQKILRLYRHPFDYDRHNYIMIPYLKEDGMILPSGVGHEVIYNQAADTSLLNLYMDNLKVVANDLIVVKVDSRADQVRGNIGPGRKISTDDPEGDIRALQLGAELTQILEAIQENRGRGARNSRVTDLLSGRGDAIMKSGTGASQVQSLIQEGGRSFREIDRSIKSALSDGFMLSLLQIQQFAPNEVFYQALSDETAERMVRHRFRVPAGDLEETFRIEVQAPSAATNQEAQKQGIMLILNLAREHYQAALALIADAFGEEDPQGVKLFKQKVAIFTNELFNMSVRLEDVPGLRAPEMMEPTDMQQVANRLTQQLGELQQQLEQLTQKNQQLEMQLQAPPAPQGPPMMPPQGPPPGMMG